MTIREAVRQGAQLLRTSPSLQEERSVIASGLLKADCAKQSRIREDFPGRRDCFMGSQEGRIAMTGTPTDTPALDSELLMAYALGIDRGQVIARGNDDVDASTFFHYIECRQCGTPVAYITGVKEFYGLDFAVTPEVLIPKPDTETLVELAIDFVGKHHVQNIVDVCAGSGCVGISISHSCHVPVTFTDISPSALDVCKENARRLLKDVHPVIASGAKQSLYEFLCGDLLDVFPPDRTFHLIVSNPPYIPHADVEPLLSDGRGEPSLALDGGADGLDVTRRLVSQAAEHLAPRGALMVESNEEGTAQVAEMMLQAGLADVQTYTDLAGLPRVAVGAAP